MRRALDMGGLPALAAGGTGFFRAELMRRSFFMCGLATLTGNFSLALRAHRRKATAGGSSLIGNRTGLPSVRRVASEFGVSRSIRGLVPVVLTALIVRCHVDSLIDTPASQPRRECPCSE